MPFKSEFQKFLDAKYEANHKALTKAIMDLEYHLRHKPFILNKVLNFIREVFQDKCLSIYNIGLEDLSIEEVEFHYEIHILFIQRSLHLKESTIISNALKNQGLHGEWLSKWILVIR